MSKKSNLTKIQKERYKENKRKNEEAIATLGQKKKSDKPSQKKPKNALKYVLLVLVILVFTGTLLGGMGYYVFARSKDSDKLFAEGLTAVQNSENKWGYINKNGKVVIGFEFDNAFNFTANKLALVKKNGRFGYINTKGKLEIDYIYQDALSFDGNIAICKRDDMYGIIDKNGEVVCDFTYRNISSFQGNYAIARQGSYYGIIDRNGEVIVDFEYSLIDQVNTTYFRYVKNQVNCVEFLDVDGDYNFSNKVYSGNFQDVILVPDGSFIFKRNGYYGLMNKTGETVIPANYVDLTYGGGKYLRYSSTGDYYGYLDFEGNVVLEDKYESLSYFNGYAIAKYEDSSSYDILNKNLKKIFSLECDEIRDFKNGRAIFKKDDLYGVVSTKGKIIVEAKYKFIGDFFDDDYAIFSADNSKYGVLSSKGREKIKPIYNQFLHNDMEKS